MKRHINSDDLVLVGLWSAGVFIVISVVTFSLFLLPSSPPLWVAPIAGLATAFFVALVCTLFLVGRAIYDWYIYDSWKRK